MADELSERRLNNKIDAYFEAVATAGDRVVGIIGGMKDSASKGKALINTHPYLTPTKIAEQKAEFVSDLLVVKGLIETALAN